MLVSAPIAIFALQKEKKACNSPRSEPNISVVFSEDDQVLEALNMTEKIATRLERIFDMLAGVESRLQNLEGIFERSPLWRSRLAISTLS